ncbi:MAG TPA: hypothetical protein VHI52_06450, partial [Verrucomicrobiae bacterium]|nr:hypothetical protein [Verrucomicrobiae bacterium]
MSQDTAALELIHNGDFERVSGSAVADWQPAPNRYALSPGQGRNSSTAIRCENTDEQTWSGASQTIKLDGASPVPLVVRGWSRAEHVNGARDNDYSIYVDLIYTDGSPLWGQTANFRTGTHGWQERQVIILPQKPVRSITVHCLLRHHSGIAWFDDVSVKEIRAGGGAYVFEGVPVTTSPNIRRGAGDEVGTQTEDGLKLRWREGAVESLQVEGHELACSAPSGFMARDVAANSDFYGFTKSKCPELGLALETESKAEADHIVFDGRVRDLRGKDRALTLVFALPIDATGWEWGDDIRRSRRIGGGEDYGGLVTIHCGATGSMSL